MTRKWQSWCFYQILWLFIQFLFLWASCTSGQRVWLLRNGVSMYFLTFAYPRWKHFTHYLKADSCRTWSQHWAPVSFFDNLDLASVLNWGFAKIYRVLGCARYCIRDFTCLFLFPRVHIPGNLNGRIVCMVVCCCFVSKLFHLWFYYW